MMDFEGNLKIIDMGLVVDIDQEYQCSGTIYYISPLKYNLALDVDKRDKFINTPAEIKFYPDFEIYALSISIVMIEYKLILWDTLAKDTKVCFKKINIYCFVYLLRDLFIGALKSK